VREAAPAVPRLRKHGAPQGDDRPGHHRVRGEEGIHAPVGAEAADWCLERSQVNGGSRTPWRDLHPQGQVVSVCGRDELQLQAILRVGVCGDGDAIAVVRAGRGRWVKSAWNRITEQEVELPLVLEGRTQIGTEQPVP
jgi:hypothetical protein